jgi:parallel beta-helix repeat protein
MHDSVARNNEIWNVPTGISFSESPNNEVYGNNIHDVTRGIYFVNASTMDDGVTRNNNAHDNTINNANYAIQSSRSSSNTVSNNNIGTTRSYEYYLDISSGLIIENQEFSSDRIRGNNGANSIKIQNSGTITVGGTSYDTNVNPYTKTLSLQLQGRTTKEQVIIEGLVLPPLASSGPYYSPTYT